MLYLQKEYAASLEACEHVIELNPTHFGALSGGGMCALSRGDVRGALQWFQAALSVNPRLEGAAQYVSTLKEHAERMRDAMGGDADEKSKGE